MGYDIFSIFASWSFQMFISGTNTKIITPASCQNSVLWAQIQVAKSIQYTVQQTQEEIFIPASPVSKK